jgi:hypothetical protein
VFGKLCNIRIYNIRERMSIMRIKFIKAITEFTILTVLLTGCGDTTKGNKSVD